MYKEKLLATLKAGKITDLQQEVLKQEFLDALRNEGFKLCQCTRQGLLCRYKDDGIYLHLATDQALGEEAEAPDTQAWGHWFLCDADARPLCSGSSASPANGGKAPGQCSGFWLEGIENIGCFIKTYQRGH